MRLPKHLSVRNPIFLGCSFVSTLLVALTAYLIFSFEISERKDEVHERLSQINRAVSLQFALIENEVASVAAEISRHGIPDPEEFFDVKERTERLVEQSFVRAVGYSPLVERENGASIEEFFDRNKSAYLEAGYKDFIIFPPTEKPYLLPIILVEPADERLGVFGLDMAVNPLAEEKTIAAITNGQMDLIGPIVLREDQAVGRDDKSFLIMAPVTIDDEVEAFWRMGVVAAPITPEQFLKAPSVAELLVDTDVFIRVGDLDRDEIRVAGSHAATSAFSLGKFQFRTETQPVRFAGNTIRIAVAQEIGVGAFSISAFLLLSAFIFSIALLSAAYLSRITAEKALVERALSEQANALRDTERNLAKAQKQEALGHLVGGVAHDFNNLLGVMQGNAELLHDISDSSEQQEFITEILQSVERGASLSHQLLAFGRRAHLDPKAENLADILRDIKKLIARIMPSNIELQFDKLKENYGLEIDRSQLENAIINLAVNARDAMPNGGLIKFSAKSVSALPPSEGPADGEETDYVQISVEDTGHGMGPEMTSKAFDPFFTTKPVGQGTGLGLSMVFGFAKQSGGTATIESTPGSGTTVSIYLPTTNKPMPSDTPIREEAAQTAKDSAGTILVAEDEVALQLVLRKNLESAGYKVFVANTGDEALGVVENGLKPDLIVTDIVMPGSLQGPALVKAVRQQIPEIKSIFISGYPAADALGVEEFNGTIPILQKPITRQKFLRSVEHIMKDFESERPT